MQNTGKRKGKKGEVVLKSSCRVSGFLFCFRLFAPTHTLACSRSKALVKHLPFG